MGQALQIAGAAAILVAYGLAQLGVLDDRSYRYLVLNLVGAGLLAVLAYHERQWGFLLLEVAWTLITAWSLTVRLRGLAKP